MSKLCEIFISWHQSGCFGLVGVAAEIVTKVLPIVTSTGTCPVGMVSDSDEVVTSNEPCWVGVDVNCEEFVISSEKSKDDGEVTSKETGPVEKFDTM